MQGVRSLGKKGGMPGAVFLLPGSPGEHCLDASAGSPRTRGPAGLRDMGSGLIRSAEAAAPRAYPTWRARLRRGEKRRGAGGAGFQLALAGLLPRSAALRSPPARSPGRFQSQPAPPLALARPQPLLRSSPLRISRSQPGLRLPPDSCTQLLALRLWLGFFAGLPSRSCPPRGAESSGAPALRRSRCLSAPSTPRSDCSPQSSGHGTRGQEGH